MEDGIEMGVQQDLFVLHLWETAAAWGWRYLSRANSHKRSGNKELQPRTNNGIQGSTATGFS